MSAPSPALSSPVTVFLSYSHRDDEWKEGLKRALGSLSGKRHISIWDDRKIKAGTGWEPEIEQQLTRARIVLLLVTEDYVASEWCRRERDQALSLQRADPEKRVIPLFVKYVSLAPDDPIRALQGLPRDMKWADSWAAGEQNKPRGLIADGILEEIYPFATQPNQPNPPVHSKPGARLDPKFVDRETQEREFRDFWDLVSWSRPGAPQIYILPAAETDCPAYFVDRLREDTIQRLANTLRGVDRAGIPDPIIVPEPPYQSLERIEYDLARDLFDQCGAPWNPSQLSAKPLARLEQFRLNSFILIQHTLRADLVGRDLSTLLSWYVNTFWAGVRADCQFLIFLHLLYPLSEPGRATRFWRRWMPSKPHAAATPEREMEAQLKGFLSEGRANLLEDSPGTPVKLLPQLLPIELEDIKNWLRRLPGMLPHKVDAQADELFRAVLREGGSRFSYCWGPLRDFYAKQLGAQSSDRR